MAKLPVFRNSLATGQHFIKEKDHKERAITIDSGERVYLEHVKDNKFDPYAVGVFDENTGWQIGWVPAVYSPVTVLLLEGAKVVGEVTGRGKNTDNFTFNAWVEE